MLAPKIDFKSRSSLDVKYEQNSVAIVTSFDDKDQAPYEIEVGGLKESPTERCKKIIQEELLNVQAELYQKKEVIEHAVLDPEVSRSNVVRDEVKAIYILKNPDHRDEQTEVFARHLLVKMNLPEAIRQNEMEDAK